MEKEIPIKLSVRVSFKFLGTVAGIARRHRNDKSAVALLYVHF